MTGTWKLLLCVLVALALALAMIGIPDALALECPLPPLPIVLYETEYQPPSLDASKSAAELGSIARAASPKSAERYEHVLGISLAEIVRGGSVKTASMEAAPRFFCTWPTLLTIRLGYSGRTIYVAREAAEDACIEEAIRKHETSHATLDEDLLEQFRSRAIEAIRPYYERMVAQPSSSHSSGEARLKEQLDGVFEELFQSFATERSTAQAEIDSPDEIQRVTQACEGKVGQLRSKLEFRTAH